MLKNLLDTCGAAIAFFAVGYAFAYGGEDPESPTKTFIGTSGFFLKNISDDKLAMWIFEYAFAATSTTIVAGALAERCQMIAYLCYSFVLTGWVYPVIVHSVWNQQGFLSGTSVDPLWGVGMLDFAGSGVVHLTGGATALLAAWMLGPRKGRFHDETGRRLDTPRDFPGHSIALQMLGAFLLWVGWFGFNTGAALVVETPHRGNLAALAAVNTALGASMGGISALCLNLIILERFTGEPFFDLKFAINGTLSGAVAITGACALVEPWVAVVIGFIAGILYSGGHYGLLWMGIDDCVDAVPGRSHYVSTSHHKQQVDTNLCSFQYCSSHGQRNLGNSCCWTIRNANSSRSSLWTIRSRRVVLLLFSPWLRWNITWSADGWYPLHPWMGYSDHAALLRMARLEGLVAI